MIDLPGQARTPEGVRVTAPDERTETVQAEMAFRRSDWDLDKYEWPGGLELFIYDDGRVKLGAERRPETVGEHFHRVTQALAEDADHVQVGVVLQEP